MRDYLLDIVQHTHGLGVISLVKIIGDKTTTKLQAYDQTTKTVVVDAEFKAPIGDFQGTFGMPNLDRLNTILNIPEYREDADITVAVRSDNKSPESINFINKSGDFKNNYRFMGEAVVNSQMQEVKLKGGVKWGVELVPTNASIQKMKFQASAHNDSTVFSTKLEDGNLVIYFGDPASHTGNFVFAHDCGGTLTKQFSWNVSVFLSVMSLPGDKTLKISDQGLAEITVDSGLAVYSYKFLSQSK